jgi:hypothetical protein
LTNAAIGKEGVQSLERNFNKAIGFASGEEADFDHQLQLNV